jgi:hypothetical protein
MINKIYAKYISTESILMEVDTLGLSISEKQHLIKLVDQSLHHAILDEILSSLSSQDKKIFLHRLQQGDEKELMDFLNKQVDNIEEKIKTASSRLVEELHQDIKEAKRLKHD